MDGGGDTDKFVNEDARGETEEGMVAGKEDVDDCGVRDRVS